MASHTAFSRPVLVSSPTYENDLVAATGDVAFRLWQEFIGTVPAPAEFRVHFDVSDTGGGTQVVFGTATNDLAVPGMPVHTC